jgi:hypothetical protein
MEKTNLTVTRYAKLCGVSIDTIYKRIDSGDIVPESKIVEKVVMYIDTEKYPPVGDRRAKKNKKQ